MPAVRRHAINGKTFAPTPNLGAGLHKPTDVLNAAPDFVGGVSGTSDAVVGYVKKTDAFNGNVVRVLADGGNRLVGHIYPAKASYLSGRFAATSQIPTARR